jgi:hypothetical protein
MPRGSKAAYSSKQRRMAHHVEEGYEQRGSSRRRAARIGWATVNKRFGGATRRSSRSTTKGSRSMSRGRSTSRSHGRSTRSSRASRK